MYIYTHTHTYLYLCIHTCLNYDLRVDVAYESTNAPPRRQLLPAASEAVERDSGIPPAAIEHTRRKVDEKRVVCLSVSCVSICTLVPVQQVM